MARKTNSKKEMPAKTKPQSALINPGSFLESHIRVKRTPVLNNPLLVVGLPGIGFVSKLAADHLIRELRAEHFATLYSPNFPNQVIALKSGNLKLFSMRFYYKKLKKRDLVVLKGDVQPLTVEGQYEVSAKILSYFAGLGGSEAIAMAGYAVNRQGDKPTVYCASTSKQQLSKFKKLGAKHNAAIVPIVGMAGLVPAIARLYGQRGTCLLVETSGHAVDAKGASALVEIIAKAIGEKLDPAKLKSDAKKAEDLLRTIEQQAGKEMHQQQQGAMPELPRKEPQTYIH